MIFLDYERRIILMISLDEAKELLTKEKSEKLRQVVTNSTPVINLSNKLHNDIVMAALCDAVENDVIHVADMDEKMIKLPNSNTNTLSYPKLINILHTVHNSNPKIVCHIKLLEPDPYIPKTINEWIIDGNNGVSFHDIFEYVVKKFEITPHDIRVKMTETLKSTVVNNVAQLVSRYITSDEEERKKMVISIKTICRLVNMIGKQITAEFVKEI